MTAFLLKRKHKPNKSHILCIAALHLWISTPRSPHDAFRLSKSACPCSSAHHTHANWPLTPQAKETPIPFPDLTANQEASNSISPQCWTHQYLGWKLRIVNGPAPGPPPARPWPHYAPVLCKDLARAWRTRASQSVPFFRTFLCGNSKHGQGRPTISFNAGQPESQGKPAHSFNNRQRDSNTAQSDRQFFFNRQ